MFWLWLLYAALQIADVISTEMVRVYPGAVEVNPLMAYILAEYGIWGASLLKLLVVVLVSGAIFCSSKESDHLLLPLRAALMASNVIYLVVVMNNLLVLFSLVHRRV